MTIAAAEEGASAKPAAAGSAAKLAVPGWVIALVLPLALAFFYEAAFRLGYFEARLLPPPSRVGKTLWELASSGELFTHIGATLARVGAGFVIGGAAGILGGALTASIPMLRLIIDPTIQALRAVPSLAWVPLFILWFGIFEAPKVTLIAVGVFFPVYLGVLGSILAVDRKIVEVGRIFRLSSAALVRRILLPAILPPTIIALRTGLGLGFMFVVAAELMGASEGLGFLLVDGQQLGKPDQILAAIIAFAVLGKICDGLIAAAAKPFLRWQDAFDRTA